MKQFKLVDNILGWLAFLLQPSYIVAPLSRQPVFGTVRSLLQQGIS